MVLIWAFTRSSKNCKNHFNRRKSYCRVFKFTSLTKPYHENLEVSEQDLVAAEKSYASYEKKVATAQKSLFGSVLTIIIGLVTILSLTFGIASGLHGEHLLFKISTLISVALVLVGIYLLHLANEKKEQLPIYVKGNDKRMVSVLRRTGKKRKGLLFSGWGNIALGILVFILALFIIPS